MLLAKEVSEQLALNAETVVQYLFPNGRKMGNEWCVGDISGSAGNSLKIRLSGPKAGLWCDFANAEEKGDLIDLWAKKRNKSVLESMKEASGYIGITGRNISDYSPKKFAKPTIENEVALQDNNKVLAYLTNERLLTRKTLQQFRISTTESEIIFPYYHDDELVFAKFLKLERKPDGRKLMRTTENSQPTLFGWHTIPADAREVVICEGEIDAMTMSQYGFNALSLPIGAGIDGKHKWIDYDYEKLSVFDTIYLCFDNDEFGKPTAEFVSDRLGRFRCKIVILPAKDANECLQQGLNKEAIDYYIQQARTIDPEGLSGAEDDAEAFIKECFYPDESKKGYESPWEKTKKEICFRPNELSIWTGTNGHGKSQFLGQVVLSMMSQGARVCVASLELRRFKFLKRLMIQATATREFSERYAREVLKWYGGKLWTVSLYSKDKAKNVLEIFTYARQRYGIDVFVIDPFAKLGIAQDDYRKQTDFIEELCDFKEKYNCQIHVVAHPRKGSDESMSPGKLDVKGSGVITDLADNCFTVWRNKAKEEVRNQQRDGRYPSLKDLEKLQEPDVYWRCDKQRDEDGEECVFSFSFDNSSLQYLEGDKVAAPYFKYSCLK